MAFTLGSTAEPTNSAEAWQGTNYSQHANLYSIPSGGPWLIQTVWFWAAGYGANTLARACVWGGTGTLLGYSTTDVTLIARSFSSTGSDLYGTNVYANGPGLAPCIVAGGSSLFVGFQRSEGGSSGAFFGKLGSGTHYDRLAAGYLDVFSGSTSHAGALGSYLTYIASNTAPTAPSWSSPADGSIVGTTTPTLVFIHNDPDGDAVANYDLQVDATSGNGVNPDWSSLAWEAIDSGVGASGNTITRSVGPLTRGQWYAARARTADVPNGDGPWSAVRYFKINQLPTVSSRDPG